MLYMPLLGGKTVQQWKKIHLIFANKLLSAVVIGGLIYTSNEVMKALCLYILFLNPVSYCLHWFLLPKSLCSSIMDNIQYYPAHAANLYM